MRPVAVRPDGALLSCYTAAVAEALWRRGGDWAAAIGLGSVLAIRPEGELFAFRHHSTSLRPLLAPDLHRTGADDASGLLTGLSRAYERHGWVIAIADVHNLPWSTGRGRRHAPHWCVVDGRDEGRWHITDRFTMRDAGGEQPPWEGWISDEHLPAVLATAPGSPEQRLRDRFPFGDEEPEPVRSRYQWFATGGHADLRPRGEWLCGAAALRRLAGHYAERGADPAAYRQTEDLWVTARHRRLRQVVLQRDGSPEAGKARELADTWERVPMMLHYAEESARRGRPKLTALRTALEAVTREESRLEGDLGGRSG
ncbi:hypothetical protein [Saccharothrix coeruleofusca]|uniref:Uncharacterized protein n=1 Tax=Saccharothrix coeruleofusca TaxID=33919 RepID=A0A918ASN6_9PSEU|nr:hypothetical protein [Saccharothrix coeruleofusca]MBP2336685.1 hypothetical protein [Saccharothrix coeruleofusca]GGP78747.1 hypothetical protein GCM10010185_60730 [Saccharothrix coeruleofusca]